jgi:hypothetical protein
LTPEEHNKYVAISHLVYGGFMVLFCLGMIGLFIGVFSSIPDGPPPAVAFFMTIFIGALYSLMTVPSLIAGYGLLKHKHWARTAAIIGAVTAAMNFPLGTAACVYTFWFLFSEPGKAIFERRNYMLPPGRQSWAYDVQKSRSESTYTPPPTPPDWR